MKKDLNRIFIGSDIEANYIASLLLDNQIKCIVQNTLSESINAGWVSGSQESSSTILVKTEDTEKARKIINDYIENKNKT